MRSELFRYGVAILAVTLATATQTFLDPLLEQSLPLPPFLIAVAASVRYGGQGPAVAASVLGYLAINFFFIEPRGMLAIDTTSDVIVLASYSLTCVLFIGFGSGIRRAHARVEASRSETVEKQRRLSAIVDTAVDGIITIDEHGIIDSANPAAERIFGYRADEMVGRNVSVLMPEPYRSEHDTYLANYLNTGERKVIGIGREVRGRRRDGIEFPLELAVSETRLVGRRLFTGIVRDVTERRRAHEALKLADRRKDEFLAQLAHELRNPLAPIVTALETARLRGKWTDELAVIDRQVHHLIRLIDDLLDVSRITRGILEIRKERVELGDAVRTAVEACRPQIEQRDQQFTLDLPDDPLWVDGDAVRLTQVFANLLSNAAKFTEPRGNVSLAVERQEAQAVLRFADSGVGIAAEELSRVFEMFFQGGRQASVTPDGLGIGLFLVKRLVALHGGTVEVANRPHGGSEFRVCLPLVAAPAEQPSEAAPVLSAAAGTAQAARRILVVDDNRDAADSLSEVLRLTGNEVATGYDGDEAMALAETFRPDVVLLDLGLPKSDGYEVCRRLKAQPWAHGTQIIALTGWGRQEDSVRTKASGFAAHLVKPVNPIVLEKLLVSPVDGPSPKSPATPPDREDATTGRMRKI